MSLKKELILVYNTHLSYIWESLATWDYYLRGIYEEVDHGIIKAIFSGPIEDLPKYAAGDVLPEVVAYRLEHLDDKLPAVLKAAFIGDYLKNTDALCRRQIEDTDRDELLSRFLVPACSMSTLVPLLRAVDMLEEAMICEAWDECGNEYWHYHGE